ncbi:type II/IV secretion system protein [Candidatus Nomurabacteria bacterium]|nr:type II/IV secretion system protein [Candidatus Nomurabacteria bacterium]MCB9820378.1 type II/IV secretion system protein [Candidatus Nomurabacteria bacterium]
MYIKENELRKFIEQSGLVSAEDIKTASNESKKTGEPFENILLREGKVKEDELRRMEAYVLGIPFVSLVNQKIDTAVLSLIPEPLAAKNNIVAYRRSDRGLEVAMLDIDDLPVLDFIKKKVGLKILPRLTDASSMKDALNQYKKSLKADFDAIIQKESQSLKAVSESDEGGASEKDLKEMAEDLPIIKIVDTLISHAIIQNASDIHIEPQEASLLVRYRTDGILHDAMVLPKETAAGIVARIKVLSNLKLDEKRLPQDGRFRITTEAGDRVSFRVSTLPIYFGEKVVIRLLKENSKGFTLEGLGFHGEGLEKIHNAMRQTTGMILATGPTGSGKTTTLYTVLDMLNTPDVNISTVEDPIEYQMPRINQTQVKSEIGLTFANGLRTLLRQDPDIIMVGEIRDGETVSLAINAALTGHLVLSTIHTNSAAGAIPRMIDMGAESFLIVSTVKTIIAQRLVRRLCNSKEKYFMEDAEIQALGKLIDLDRMLDFLKAEKLIKNTDTWKEVPLYRPKPGAECEDGYKGRVGIHEVMDVTPTIKELILKGASSDDIEAQAKKEGMMTMLEDGIYQAVLGLTSTEEVLRVITE